MEIEIIDLDEVDRDLEEQEEMYDSDGYHKETQKYNADYDAWYPSFDSLYEAEKEIKGKRTY